nr:MAG: integrase, tyrosine recombinase superfamily [uncultured archaeon]
MIETQLNCGLRVSEMAHLSIDVISLDGGFLRIGKRKKDRYVDAFKPKTEYSKRIISLSPKTIDILREQIGKRKHGYVFPSNKGGHFRKSSIIKFINKYARECKTIGFNIGSHALRRSYASYLISNPKRRPFDKEITISDICKLLGHKNIETTMKYLFNIVNLVDFEKIRVAIDRWHK